MHTKKIKFCMQNFFSENVCLRTKLDLRLEKKFLGQVLKITTEKFLCRMWKLYGKLFFKKKFQISFFCYHCSTVLKKPQK